MVDTSKFVQDLAQLGKTVIAGSAPLVQLNEARNRGNTLATENQILQDRSTLSPFDFGRKYGQETQRIVDQADQANVALGKYMLGATRTNQEVVDDTAAGLFSAAVQSVGSIGVLGAGIVNDKAGVEASDLLNSFTNYSRSGMSEYIKRNEFIEGVRTTLDEQDNEKQYQADLAKDGEFFAGMSYFGRGALNTAQRLANNPAALEDTVTQGIGSLVAGGPVAKGLRLAGVAAKAAMPISIGLMEGGGAYDGSVQDIMSRSHEELMQTSPDYRAAVSAGQDPQTVKENIASNAGLAAAAIQGPVGALVGKVAGIADFEAAPFASRKLGEVASNLIKEPVEEGIQGVTGQVAQNAAVSLQADPEQSLFEGAGDQLALGAIGAIGSTAVVQAPGLVRPTAEAVIAPFKYAGKTIIERYEARVAEAKASSPVAPEAVAPEVQEQATKVSEVATGLRNVAAENGAKEEDVNEYISKVERAFESDTADFSDMPGVVGRKIFAMKQEIGRNPNKFEILETSSAIANDETASEKDRVSAATYILKNTEVNKKLFTEDYPEYMQNIPGDRPEAQAFNKFADTLRAIAETPNIRQAIQWAQEAMQMPEEQIDFTSIDSNETIRNAVNVATVAPQALSSSVVDQILNQDKISKLDITDEERNVLQNGQAFAKARVDFDANMVAVGATESTKKPARNMDFVSRQIATETAEGATKLSLRDHMAGINLALSTNDKAGARAKILHLAKFAQSHINKVKALNSSIDALDGSNQPYNALGANGKFYNYKKGVGVTVGQAGSENFARTVHAEAVTMAQLVNDIMSRNPVGIPDRVVPALSLEVAEVEKVDSTNSETAPVVSATTSKQQSDPQKVEPTLPSSQQGEDNGQVTSPEEETVREPIVQAESKSSVEPVKTGEVAQDNADPITPETPTEESTPEPTEAAAKAEPRVLPNLRPEVQSKVEPVVQEAQPASELDVMDYLGTLEEDAPNESLAVQEAFPTLVQPKGRNWFWEAFRIPRKQLSRVASLNRPMASILRLMKSSDEERVSFMGSDVSYDVTEADKESYQKLLLLGGRALQHMEKRLAHKMLEEPITQKTGKKRTSLVNQFKDGNDAALRYRNFLAINIVDAADGTPRYNPQLIQSAMLAALDWMLNSNERSTPMDAEDIAKFTGLDQAAAKAYVGAFNAGVSMDMGVQALAANILKFWNLQTNPNTKMMYTTGIAEAVAKEILLGLEHAELIRTGSFTVTSNKGDKDYGRIVFTERPDDVRELVQSLDGASTLISDLALIDNPVEGYSIGEPITVIGKTQSRNPLVKISRMAQKALLNVMATPYYVSEEMVDLVSSLDIEAFVTRMSGVQYKHGDLKKTYDQTPYNKGHWNSIQGKHQSYVTSYQSVFKQLAAMQSYANKKGIPLGEVPVYYKHTQNSLGRLQLVGMGNPQSDKLAREIFTPSRATVDVSDPTSDQYLDFMKTIAQGIGEKTEQLDRDQVLAAINDRMADEKGDLFKLVQDTKTWLEARGTGQGSDITEDLFTTLIGKEMSMHGWSSAVAYARYVIAKENGADLTKFKTANYLEADGKTNGPANALAMFSAGTMTRDRLRALSKVGFFIGRKGKTLNNHFKTDDRDLYRATSESLSVYMARLSKDLAGIEPVKEHFDKFMRLLSALNVDVKLVGDKLEIKRGLSKNPLTITIYGSGAKGIAENIASELLGVLAEHMSAALIQGVDVSKLLYEDNPNQFNGDLAAMLQVPVSMTEDEQYGLPAFGDFKIALDNKTFEANPKQFDNFAENVLNFLVVPMQKSINEQVTKHTSSVTSKIQQATQVQSIILQKLFLSEVINELALMQSDPEKYDYKAGEFLSQTRLNEILAKLGKFSPTIDTGTQSYMMSSGEKSALFKKVIVSVDGKETTVSMPEEFSTTLDGKFGTPAKARGPVQAGVRAIPVLTIGSGDAQMMLNFLSQYPEAAQRVLHVFDGLNIPADKVREYSRNINESVFKTWTSNKNPVAAVFENYERFVAAGPMEALLNNDVPQYLVKEALLEISRVFHGSYKVSSKLTAEEAEAFMLGIGSDLLGLTIDTNTTRRLYAAMPSSVDQMASGETPYVHEGTIEIGEDVTDDEIVDIMETHYKRMWEEEADKLLSSEVLKAIAGPVRKERERRKPAAAVEAENKKFVEKLQQIGNVGASGARVLLPSHIPMLADAIKGTGNKIQAELAEASLELMQTAGYRVIFGTSEQLDAWEYAENPEAFINGSNDQFGKINPAAKTILISNMSPETVVHEMIHAATIDKVRMYFTDPVSLDDQDLEAVTRIKSLMEEWLDATGKEDEWAGMDAEQLARSAILSHLRNDREAEAVNEFMAWVLSNQYLADRASSISALEPLSRWIKSAIDALKQLIFGGKNKPAKVGNDILSNLRFSARVLMTTPTPVSEMQQLFAGLVMYQSATFGDDPRMTVVRESLKEKILNWIEGDPDDLESYAGKEARERQAESNDQAAEDIANSYANFFPGLSTMQGYSTFGMMQAALMADIELNPNALARIEEIYTHVIKTIRVEDFRKNADPDDQADAAQARDKYDVLTGLYTTRTDSKGRSSLMSSFLALATVDAGFRQILDGMERPKADASGDVSIDGRLQDIAAKALDRVTIFMSGEKSTDASVREALDNLTVAMIKNVGDQRSYIEKTGESFINRYDKKFAKLIQDGSAATAEKAAEIVRTSNSRVVKVGASLVNVIATTINEQKSQQVAQGLIENLNNRGGLEELKAFVNDIVGRTKDNAHVVDMVSLVRSTVQQVRQRFRDDLPKILDKKFTSKPTEDQQTVMFKALGKTDIAAVAASIGVTDALNLLGDYQALSLAITVKEQAVRAADPSRFDAIKAKSLQLANFMNTRVYGQNLLSNAEAIARLPLDQGLSRNDPADQLVKDIDELVSLYAMDGLSRDTLNMMSALLQNEREGLEFMVNYLVGQRKDELAKIGSNIVAKANYYKGDIPSEKQQGGSLVIKDATEHDRLILQGYKLVAPYVGSSADRYLTRKSYYFSPVSPTAMFTQGVMQTVHTTVSGIDPETGFTVGEIMAGRITGEHGVGLARRMLNRPTQTSEHLRPVFDDSFNVVAYERTADIEQLTGLNRSTDLSKMIGAWQGRQMEELLATKVNETQVDRLFENWDNAPANRRSKEYVNIAKLDPKEDDVILVEAAKLLPRQTKDYAEAKFGKDEFWVRRDVLLDVFGARHPSVSDLFNGNTRWSKTVAGNFEKIAIGLFGNRVMPVMTSVEKNVQEFVANAKTTIVVRSVVVPAANLVSNMLQLLNRGVSLTTVVRGVPRKAAEINTYIKNEKRKLEIEVDLRAAQGEQNLEAIRRLSNEVRSIDDGYRRLSIWPLIVAGEFSAISNGQVTTEDLALADGKWGSWVERKIASLPKHVREPLRYGLVTRDTALFQGLARATQYGDFIAKAILYDDLVKNKKIEHQEAVAEVSDAFVNYNRPMGRNRQYLESVGLLWFYNYKLRIMKEAAYTLRHHPLRSLLMMAVPPLPGIGEAGSTITDNVVSLGFQNSLGFSMGFEMGLNSFGLNPWMNVSR